MSGANNYGGCPAGAAYDATDKNCFDGGDGDGDGDCSEVTRTFVTDISEDSGAFGQVTGASPGSPILVPTASPLVLPITGVATSGGASISPSGEITITADALHKAACNLGIIKIGGGANVCRVQCEAQYGPPFAPWAPVPGGTFDVSLGGFASDELPPISFEAPLFSPSFSGNPSPVRFRWTVQEIGGGGGPLGVYRGYIYGFQIQPVITRTTIQNCEKTSPPTCPAQVATSVSIGGAPPVPFTGTPISVGAGAPVDVILQLDAALTEPITTSTPPGATYNPGPMTIVWSYIQPPTTVNVSAETASCEYDLGLVTDGTP